MGGSSCSNRTPTRSSGVRSPRSPLEEDEAVGGPKPQDHLADDVLVRHRPEGARVGRELTVVAKHEYVALRNGEGEPHGRGLGGRRLATSLRELDDLTVNVNLAVAGHDRVSALRDHSLVVRDRVVLGRE